MADEEWANWGKDGKIKTEAEVVNRPPPPPPTTSTSHPASSRPPASHRGGQRSRPTRYPPTAQRSTRPPPRQPIVPPPEQQHTLQPTEPAHTSTEQAQAPTVPPVPQVKLAPRQPSHKAKADPVQEAVEEETSRLHIPFHMTATSLKDLKVLLSDLFNPPSDVQGQLSTDEGQYLLKLTGPGRSEALETVKQWMQDNMTIEEPPEPTPGTSEDFTKVNVWLQEHRAPGGAPTETGLPSSASLAIDLPDHLVRIFSTDEKRLVRLLQETSTIDRLELHDSSLVLSAATTERLEAARRLVAILVRFLGWPDVRHDRENPCYLDQHVFSLFQQADRNLRKQRVAVDNYDATIKAIEEVMVADAQRPPAAPSPAAAVTPGPTAQPPINGIRWQLPAHHLRGRFIGVKGGYLNEVQGLVRDVKLALGDPPGQVSRRGTTGKRDLPKQLTVTARHGGPLDASDKDNLAMANRLLVAMSELAADGIFRPNPTTSRELWDSLWPTF